MPRRRSESDRFLDEILSTFRIVPWWVGPLVILFTWVLFWLIVPAVLSGIASRQKDSMALPLFNMLSSISAMLSPVFAAMVGLIWIISLLKKTEDGQRLERQTGIESIRHLSWREFEHLLAEAFRRQGYSVRDTGPGADGGVDIVLYKDSGTTLVQAKQWKAWKVGVKVVRELFGIQAARDADAAILVTSGCFTNDAQQFAQDNGIKLIDGAALERMIADVQRSNRTVSLPKAEADAAENAEVSALPSCPVCGSTMVQRTAKRGANAGHPFWGCSRFPACKGIRPIA